MSHLFSIPEIIRLGDISVPLAANYQYEGEIMGKRLATTSPLTIAIVTDALRWHYEGFPPTSITDAVGSITVTNVGDDGDRISVTINDTILGTFVLGTYIKQPTDTTVNGLAQNIFNALTNLNGYTTSLQDDTITITVRPGLGDSMNGDNRLQAVINVPTISTTTLTAFGNTVVNTNSPSKSFQVSGDYLYGYTGNITITSPSTNFQVSNDNSTWGSSTTIPFTSDTINNVPVYVRFSPQSTGTLSTNLSITGGGISAPVLVPVSGLSVNVANLTATPLNPFPNTLLPNVSASQAFDLSGTDLTGAPGLITVTAPNTNFQVSTNGTVWVNSVTIPYNSPALASTPVYVRFSPQSLGVKTGNISISGGGASTSVAVSGAAVVEVSIGAVGLTSITFSSIKTANGFYMLWNPSDPASVQSFASGTITNITRTYSPAFTGNIKLQVTNYADVENIEISNSILPASGFPVVIEQTELVKLTGLKILTTDKYVKFNGLTTANINRSLEEITVTNSYMSGLVGSLPTGLTKIALLDNNTVNGTLNSMYTQAPNITYVRIGGSNTISGTIGSINTNTTYFSLIGSNTVNGSLSAMPSLSDLTFFLINGLTYITGDLSDINGGDWSVLNWVEIGGNQNHYQPTSNITGNIDNITFSTSMTGFYVRNGINTITGDVANLPDSLTNLYIDGLSSLNPSGTGNTLFGELVDLPSSLTGLLGIAGRNTLNGDLIDLPCINLQQILISGNFHTISGSIIDVPNTIRYVSISGDSHTVQGYPGTRTWGNSGIMNYVKLQGTSTTGISNQSEANQFIIDLDYNTTWQVSSSFITSPLEIRYKGLDVDSAPAIAAKNSLIAKGVAVVPTA